MKKGKPNLHAQKEHRLASRGAEGGESREGVHDSSRNVTDPVLSCSSGCSPSESNMSISLEREEPSG